MVSLISKEVVSVKGEEHHNSRKKGAALLALIVTLAILMPALLIPMSGTGSAYASNTAKNAIVMIPDGASAAHYTLARWYSNASLALDEMPTGLVSTFGAESIIVDSAPAATAFATGYKTSDKYLGILPGPVTIPGVAAPSAADAYKPIANLMEAAKLSGKSIGMIATSQIQHATPAAFSAHWHDRGNYTEIAEQQVYGDFDVILGGGKTYLLPTALGGERRDGENLVTVLQQQGYTFVETREQMLANTSAAKLYGAFAATSMAHDFDRSLPQFSNEPSLAEMTEVAIEVLSRNPNGFVLMVEGSQVDWSSHANDPVGVISEMLAFDSAVKVAKDFAQVEGRTLILAFTDHGNGGMTIGNSASDATYSKMPLSWVIPPLKGAKITGFGMISLIAWNDSAATIRQTVINNYGMNLTDAEILKIQTEYNTTAKISGMDYLLGPMISSRAYIGWTTHGHTGEDVTLYSYGPSRPVGFFDSTELARIVESALGLSLAGANANLYVEAVSAFATIGATTSINASDPWNKALVVQKAGAEIARFPLSTDIAKINGLSYSMQGLVLHSQKSNKVYVPAEAVRLASAVPSSLLVTPGNQLVVLSWSAPAGTIDGYHIYRQAGSAAAVAVATTAALQYADENVKPGVLYNYSVAALVAGQEMPRSGAVQVKAVASPDSPIALGIIVADNKVTLSWQAPAGDGAAAISAYKVYRTTSPGIYVGQPLATVHTLQYVDASASAGNTYYYTVKAVNPLGDGSASDQVSAVILGEKPTSGNDQPLYLAIIAVLGIAVVVAGLALIRKPKK
ncbi:MAG: alkaline phosphatase [Methanomassiliicoccales archaeon]